MKLCIICFGEFENSIKLECCDPTCSAKVCVECMSPLIRISAQRDIDKLPNISTCGSAKCRAPYLLCHIKSYITQTDVENYNTACVQSLLIEKGDTERKVVEQKRLLEKLRTERKVFIETNFPAAISLVANVALKSKLTKLSKQKTKIISDQLEMSHRRCMNLQCRGSLDSTYQCMMCLTQFCKKCERVENENHTCNKEDLESIELINGMVHCPQCKTPIEKAFGCQGMTCGMCNHKFRYDTGESGGTGNHGSNIPIQTDKEYLFSNEYCDILEKENAMELMIEIESLAPKMCDDNSIRLLLRQYIDTEDNSLVPKIVKAHNLYTILKYSNSVYQRFMRDIEDILKATAKESGKALLLLQMRYKIKSWLEYSKNPMLSKKPEIPPPIMPEPQFKVLKTGSVEYKNVSDAFLKSLPHKRVYRIERNKNIKLLNEYKRKKEQIMGKELLLFHGSIIDETKCKDGIYFSPNSSYSDGRFAREYITISRNQCVTVKSMLYCLVTLGTRGVNYQPSSTNYVVFHSHQCYPKYLIYYY